MKSKIIVAILLIVIVVIGIYLFTNNNSDKNEVDEPKQNKNIVENNNVTETNTMKESEALEIGEEKYMEARDLYLGGVHYDETNNITTGEGNTYSKVINSDIIESVFSKNGLVQYLEKNEFVKKINGEYYRINADRGGDMYYIDNQLKIVSIEENKIVFDSIERYIDESVELSKLNDDLENIKTKDVINPFIIVKEDGVWKVEEYTLPL